jgi:hypothetical protein
LINDLNRLVFKVVQVVRLVVLSGLSRSVFIIIRLNLIGDLFVHERHNFFLIVLTDAETLHESSLLCFGLLNLDLACEISLILSSLLLLQKIIDGVVFARHLGKQSLLISQFSHSAFVLVKMLILDFEIIGAQLWNFRNAFVLHILSVLVRVESLDLRIFLLHKVYLAHVHRRHKQISLHLRIRELLIQCLRH